MTVETGRKLGTSDVVPQLILALGKRVDGPSVLDILPIGVGLAPVFRLFDDAIGTLPFGRRKSREGSGQRRRRRDDGTAGVETVDAETVAVQAAGTGVDKIETIARIERTTTGSGSDANAADAPNDATPGVQDAMMTVVMKMHATSIVESVRRKRRGG